MFAWILFFGIMAVGLFFLNLARSKSLDAFAETNLSGAVRLPISREALHKKLIEMITAENMFLSTRILTSRPDRIEAELQLVEIVRRNTGRIFANRLVLKLEDRGEAGSAFTWSVDVSPMADRYQKMCVILRMCAIALMVIMAFVMILLVIPSEQSGVKMQVIQTIHIGHLLWPPFMLIHRYRFHIQTIESKLINRFENLKYTLEASSDPKSSC